MDTAGSVTHETMTSGLVAFDPDTLERRAAEQREAFRAAAPFPHAVFDDFLDPAIAERLGAEFPTPRDRCWQRSEATGFAQPGKLDLPMDVNRVRLLPAYIQAALAAFNSAEFVTFLEQLTGITHLIPDPYFIGGGVHQILPGGSLALHIDFNFHKKLRLFRRLNVLCYLNQGWQPAYGGDLELWDRALQRCVRAVSPIFNRLVVFDIANAYHGHPTPLACPPTQTRKSLALYYYSVEPSPLDDTPHSVVWHTAPDAYLRLVEQHLQHEQETARAIGGCVELTVGTASGAGQTWTIDLDAPRLRLGATANARSSLSGTLDAFRDLLNGLTSLDQAASSGVLRIGGDRDHLVRFMQFAFGGGRR